MADQTAVKYKRILLKISGETLLGEQAFGIDPTAMNQLADDIISIRASGVEIAIVIGGGNFFRGEALAEKGFDRVTSDQMGMLTTVMNGLALRETLGQKGEEVVLMSSIPMPSILEAYNYHNARHALDQGKIVICCAGTGNALFSTDSAASLRAIDLKVDILLKASTVDGVYSEDPNKNPAAERFSHLTYQHVIEKRLRVMDMAAFCLCQEHEMPIRVFDARKKGIVKAIITGADEGTLISS